jgi:hypothetical protein
VTARRQLVIKRIALVRALAGGWLPAPPTSDTETTAVTENTESTEVADAPPQPANE